ncbi:MAG: DUF3298 and DUF4163 domain-containing protein [Bacillota bacterium]
MRYVYPCGNFFCPFYIAQRFRSSHDHLASFPRRSPVVVNPKEIESKEEYIHFHLTIPKLEGLPNQQVQNLINHAIESDVMEFKRQMEEAAQEEAEKAMQEGREMKPFIASSIYQVTYDSSKIFSLTMTYYELINNIHSYIKASYNFNLITGKSLGLKDLFRPGVDYKVAINAEIRKHIQANPDKYFPGTLERFHGIAEDQPFYIAKESLAVFFGFHQIAPTESQIPIIKIPLSHLSSLLKPEILSSI